MSFGFRDSGNTKIINSMLNRIAVSPEVRLHEGERLIPGSQREKKLYAHLREDRSDLVLTQRISDSAFDERQAVDVELEPGQMSLHDVSRRRSTAYPMSP